jgi:hypothetical protein
MRRVRMFKGQKHKFKARKHKFKGREYNFLRCKDTSLERAKRTKFERLAKNFQNRFAFTSFFRNFAGYSGEVTPSRQKKKRVSLFCAQLFVTLSAKEICLTKKTSET